MSAQFGVRGLVFALAATISFAAGDASGADSAIGVNAVIRNQVQMKTRADLALRPAVVRESDHIGDLVVSGPNSALQVLLKDKTVFTLGANTRITIDKFVFDPDRGASDVSLAVTRGVFRFMSGPSLHGAGRNAITTPVGSIGVRGTIVLLAVGPETAELMKIQPGIAPPTGDVSQATLVILVGPGGHNQGTDSVGAIDFYTQNKTIPVTKAGAAVLIWGPGQPPVGPFPVSSAVLARLTSDLSLTGAQDATLTTALIKAAFRLSNKATEADYRDAFMAEILISGDDVNVVEQALEAALGAGLPESARKALEKLTGACEGGGHNGKDCTDPLYASTGGIDSPDTFMPEMTTYGGGSDYVIPK
jgi:hypothetical protein